MTLATMLSNLEEMSRTIPAEKIFFYQVADAVRPAEICHDDDDMPARMKWSRNCRVFPCEPPAPRSGASSYHHFSDPENPSSGYLGFLPVTQMTTFVHRTGYRGWWSLEVFNSSLQEDDGGCPERHGRRGINGLHSLWEVVKADPVLQASTDANLESKLDRASAPSPTPSTPPLSFGSPNDSSDSELEDIPAAMQTIADHGVLESRKTDLDKLNCGIHFQRG
ncbi:hypothetical protein GYMLUDRAFT_46241 [Collybiopsis luxurians FD-317 M1]|uniref:Uncharacterized protein n=1 Tax=Collybiopsis luxurians FD-317 M1 TaxID=944289 RepID=A0A0D0CPS2_9AGAR|nr:hypothetical protein GYMLUDRAFT_46241 [Collybiopsis luxurians FD-317 M1]